MFISRNGFNAREKSKMSLVKNNMFQFRIIYKFALQLYFVLFCSAGFAQNSKAEWSFSSKEKVTHTVQSQEIASQPILWKSHARNDQIIQSQVDLYSGFKNIQAKLEDKVVLNKISYKLNEPEFVERGDFKNSGNSNLNFKYLDSKAGLPSESFRDICFDYDNNLWGLADNRIIKFSGRYTQIYGYKQGFPDFEPLTITANDSCIYIGTWGQGLFVMKDDSLHVFNKDSGFPTNHIVKVKVFGKNIVFLSSKGELFQFNLKNGIVERLDFQKTELYFKDVSINKAGITAVSSTNEVIVCDSNLSTSIFSFSTEVLVKKAVTANNEIYSINEEGELDYFDGIKWQSLRSPYLVKVKDISLGKSGLVWVFTDDQTLLMSKGIIVKQFSNGEYLSTMDIKTVVQDKMSNLWICSSNKGVGLIAPSFIKQIELPYEITNPRSSFLFVDSEGTVYLEKANGGLIRSTKKGDVFSCSIPDMKSLTAAEEIDGKLYITSFNGLFILDSTKLTSVSIIGEGGGFNSLLNLKENGNKLIINHYNHGVLIIESDTIKTIREVSTLTNDVYIDNNGNTWIANETKGLSLLKNDSIFFLNSFGEIQLNKIYSVCGNDKGDILFGTNKGLFALSEDSIIDLNPSLMGINEFKNVAYNKVTNEFWASNNQDIFIIKKQESRSYTFQKFTSNDFVSTGGVHQNSFNFYNRESYFKVGKTVSNYQWYDFSFLSEDYEISLLDVIVESNNDNDEILKYSQVKEKSKSKNEPKVHSFDHGKYSFSFLFDINFWGNEDKLEFYYRLKGLSDEWVGPTTQRKITINNLSSGDYVFEVKTKLNGKINIQPLKFNFKIESSFKESSLFLIAIIVISLLLTYILIKSFSSLAFDNVDSYSSDNALIKKLRIFSIFPMVFIPLVVYWQSEFLKHYEANWYLIGLIPIASLISLVISFSRKLTGDKIPKVLGSLFIFVISILFLVAFEGKLNYTLVVEACLLLLLPRAIFQKLKHIIVFFVYILVYTFALGAFYSVDVEDFELLLSIFISSSLVSILIVIGEGNTINNLAFANKILKNSDLFILVYDYSGKVVYLSNPLLKVVGKAERDLINYGWWEFRSKNNFDQSKLKLEIKAILKKDSARKYTNQIITESGIIDTEWSDFVLEEKFVMSIGTDVTKQLKYQSEVEMLSLVATSVTNGVCIVDKDNKLIWNNNQFKEIVGLQNKTVKGKDVIQMLVPTNADTGKFIEDLSQIIPDISQTIVFKNANGEGKYVMLTNSVAYFEDGTFRKRILVWTDITMQYIIEKRYKDIINNAFDIIYTVDPAGHFTFVNNRMTELFDIPSDDFIGMHFTELIDDSCKAEALELYSKQMDNKELYSYYEFKVSSKFKDDLWVGQNVRVVLDDSPEQAISEFHVVARDITENKKNREELKRLSYVASTTGSIVIILDPRFNIEWVNNSFSEVFGYSLEEVTGKNPGDVLNGKSTDTVTIQRIIDGLKAKKHVSEELINYDKLGNEKWIEINMDPIFDESDKLINYIAVENDITERKSQELLIGQQHQSIIDSLNYASIIQTATLPTKNDIESINKNVAIYYRPKEIIGGDFYLVDSIVDKHGHLLEIYIVADCTGHGVPGAMLSVLCSSLLKETIRNSKVKTPAQVLTFTREKLIEVFNSNGDYSFNDGMDMSICVVDRATGILDYSGANRPLFLYQNGKLITVKGDKQSVGFNHMMEDFTFTRHYFSEGDVMYLFSDGVIDQFGGPKYKKFMTSRFKQLIEQESKKMVQEQVSIIKLELDEWQGDQEQTDDICLMGVRL